MKTTDETKSVTGTIEGNAYTNKFFSVEFALPEGFSYYDAEQLADMNAAIANTNDNQAVVEAFEGGSAFFDMAAAAESDPNVSVVVQIAGPDAAAPDEAGYIAMIEDKVFDQLKAADITVKNSEAVTYTNGKTGDEFAAMKLAIEMQGAPMCEEIVCIKAGDYFMNVTATANNEAELDSILDHLARIR